MVFFSAGKGGGEEVFYGYKGKGVTGHLLVDGNGRPLGVIATGANGDERKQIEPLLDKVQKMLSFFQEQTGHITLFEADRGYDANNLRKKLLRRNIYPWICRRRKPKVIGFPKSTSDIKRKRWQVERAISWLQRKFRRLVVRWERRMKYWKGFLNMGLIKFWLQKLMG